MKRLILAALLPLGLTTAATAQQPADPAFVVPERGLAFASLDEAVQAIGSGTGTVLIAPGTYQDCTVQKAGTITLKARQPGTVVLDGGICEGKAALVLRGQGATVEGIIFQNMRVPDGNGAGIRLEQGDLTVRNAFFRESEEGILSGDDPAHKVTIDRSTFSRLGRCDRDLACAHSIYIGNYGGLTVTNSRFEKGNGGQYVKSRAPRNVIIDNSFDDTQGRATNYMIDLCNGSTGTISGNIMVQGKDKENYSTFIAVAAEARDHSSAGLSVSGNEASIAPGIDRNTVFLANWSDDRIALGENRLGPGLKAYEKR